ncbi:MAG: VCBS repeat-containing protein [Acidobacteria bacterium]|nr:VCBS repeat-containing protein [Acidobacteriota bacterium]
MTRNIHYSILLLVVTIFAASLLGTATRFDSVRAQAAPASLQQLKYNHPGLAVDLGVGLWAWPVPWDADGDGDFDLLVSCPDKPSNGVWFFENATGDTAKNKMPVFKPARRLSATRHYVMPSYVNGQMRVLTPGQEYANFAKQGLQEPTTLPVDAKFYQPEGKQTKGPKVRHNQWRYVDYDGDGALDLITGIEDWSWYGWDDAWDAKGEWMNGPLHGFVLWHRNTGTNEMPRYATPVKLEAAGRPIDVFGCPSPNFEDFDGDGDLDLLCGEFLDGFTYFENTGSRTQPRYAAGIRLRDGRGQPLTMDLQMIVPVAFDWDKDGDRDLIVGDEDGRVAFIENTGKRHKDHSPIFARPVYFQQEADTLKCGALATPVGVDWDGDGDQDILSGNTAGYIEFFENLSGPRVAAPKWAAPRRLQVNGKTFRIMAGPNGSIQGPAEAKWGYTTLSVADWDGDGLPDIVINSILGRVEWLRNIGTRKAPRLAAPQPIEVEWQGAQPHLAWGWLRSQGKALLTQWRTTPVVTDWNKDGLLDLLMLDQAGYLAFFERAKREGKLVLSAPRRVLQGENFSVTNSRHNIVDANAGLIRLNNGLAGASGRRKLCVTDWDGDGLLDLFVNSANANFLRQTAARDGAWHFKDMGLLVNENIEGHDVSPTTVDFNSDGLPDFLGGAEDGRMYYLRNPQTR